MAELRSWPGHDGMRPGASDLPVSFRLVNQNFHISAPRTVCALKPML
jgi:hypothetical protein